MSETLFLSTTTKEFGPARSRLGRLMQRTQKVHVRHQDDFAMRGVVTLRMLAEEIQASGYVFHVIGSDTGAAAPASQVDELLADLDGFEDRFPDVAVDGRQGLISYTQWEAWLALHFGKRLCSYSIDGRLPPGSPQHAHSSRLESYDNYPKKVADDDDLFDEIILSLVELKLLTDQEAKRPVWLPYPSLGPMFKGREDVLKQLGDNLHSAHGQATAIVGKAVHGLGGVGKTRLAVEFAWRHAADYSAVLLVTADSPQNLQRNLAELVGPLALNLPEQHAAEEPVQMTAALTWLNQHPGWLLILDNVDTEEAAVAVEQLLAQLHGGQVMITSRLARWSGSVQPIELGVLSPEDAMTFLLERTNTLAPERRAGDVSPLMMNNSPENISGLTPAARQEVNVAAELAGELGCLALALEQAAAYIQRQRITLADYLALWRSHEPAVHEWYDARTMKYDKSLAITWQTTIDQLDPAPLALLRLMSWLDAEPIPLFIFEGEPAQEICDQAVELLGSAPSEPTAVRDALLALADFNMIGWQQQDQTVTMHRVVQEILRTQLPEQDRTNWLTLCLRMINAAAPADPLDVRSWPVWDPLRPHCEAVVEHADAADITDPTARIIGDLGNLLTAKALYAQAEPFCRRGLEIAEQNYGDTPEQIAVYLSILAMLLQDTNRLAEAEPLMRRALDIDEQSYGAEHPNVAIRLNNLAMLLKVTNRLAEAEPLMRRALAIDEQSYGPQHPKVAIRLNNLATLLQATNRLAEAEPLMRRALAIGEQSYGAEHPTVALRLWVLAVLLRDTDRLDDAIALMDRAVSIYGQFEQQNGYQHPHWDNIAGYYRRMLQASGCSETEIARRLTDAAGKGP